MGQSLSSVLLHIVFSTKNRRKFIDDNIISEMHAYLYVIGNANGCNIFKIGGIEDHVHIFCALPRMLTISRLVEEFKTSSSKWIKTKGQQYDDFSWQTGYGAFSLGESQKSVLIKYIENQKEHHKKISFEDEFLQMLNLYKIAFDERYLWD